MAATKAKMAAATMPINAANMPVEDDIEARRASGIHVTRPFPRIVKASHGVGWVLILVGIAELVIGVLIFKEWVIVGAFWVGCMAWAAGLAGTCVQIKVNSGGFPTVAFFVQSMLCLIAASISLFLIEGAAYVAVADSDGNCVETDSCPDDTCSSYGCVCWKADVATGCAEATSDLTCLMYEGDGGCNSVGDSETLLLVSCVLHVAIIVFNVISVCLASAICCCCKYTVLLRRENGVTRVHHLTD